MVYGIKNSWVADWNRFCPEPTPEKCSSTKRTHANDCGKVVRRHIKLTHRIVEGGVGVMDMVTMMDLPGQDVVIDIRDLPK